MQENNEQSPKVDEQSPKVNEPSLKVNEPSLKVYEPSLNDKLNLGLELDWTTMFLPLACLIVLCSFFGISPDSANDMLLKIRNFLGGDLGFYYIVLGVGVLLGTLYMAFSKYGNIKLGNEEDKPQYSNFRWGTMIFTSTMAADILFFSLHEWALYYNEPYVQKLGNLQDWASTYPLFHWGPIPWAFYIILAIPFGFMLHVRGRKRQKFSEACHAILGEKNVDGILGKIIDLIAVFALLAGTSTTFAISVPLLSAACAHVFGIAPSISLTIGILITIATVYTITVLFGMIGISKLATWCTYAFFVLLAYVFFFGKEGIYIIETGISAIGNMFQNFIGMSTRMDPMRGDSFPQNWTIFYWAYWMAWCVATPFFIGSISKGRTVRNTVFGAYFWGLAGTFASFIILGNFGLSQQMRGVFDMAGHLANEGDVYQGIIQIFQQLPVPSIALIILIVTMISFYATTFDALTMVVSSYSYKRLPVDKEPGKHIRIYWAVLFILLPIALLFSESSRQQLYSLSIIAAFPIGITTTLIALSFFKDASNYLKNKNCKTECTCTENKK